MERGRRKAEGGTVRGLLTTLMREPSKLWRLRGTCIAPLALAVRRCALAGSGSGAANHPMGLSQKTYIVGYHILINSGRQTYSLKERGLC